MGGVGQQSRSWGNKIQWMTTVLLVDWCLTCSLADGDCNSSGIPTVLWGGPICLADAEVEGEGYEM